MGENSTQLHSESFFECNCVGRLAKTVLQDDAAGVWAKLNDLLQQADKITDKIKTFDLNVPVAAGVATTIGTIFNVKSLRLSKT